MSPNIYFDNIIITDDLEVAKKWADDSFEIRKAKIAEETVSTFVIQLFCHSSSFGLQLAIEAYVTIFFCLNIHEHKLILFRNLMIDI